MQKPSYDFPPQKKPLPLGSGQNALAAPRGIEPFGYIVDCQCLVVVIFSWVNYG